jgi:hypothetical protein
VEEGSMDTFVEYYNRGYEDGAEDRQESIVEYLKKAARSWANHALGMSEDIPEAKDAKDKAFLLEKIASEIGNGNYL